MDKNLMKFYFVFSIFLLIFIKTFPNIFSNINNIFEYVIVKNSFLLEKDTNIDIKINLNKANIIIMFDDSWSSQYEIAYRYMEKKGIVGSISVIPSRVGEAKYMNKAQLNKIYNCGWDILNHTYNHYSFKEIDIDNQIKEIESAGLWLNNNGFINDIKNLIYPEGEYNDQIIIELKKRGYITARGTFEGYNEYFATDLFNVKVKNINSNILVEEVINYIDYSIVNNKTIILLFHKIEDRYDESLMIYKTNDFYKIIDYIDNNKDKLNIITYTNWIRISNFNNMN